MANYNVSTESLNNMERSAGTAVFYVNAENGDGEFYEDGDIILVGAVPRESITTIGVLDIVSDFGGANVELDLGHPTYDPDGNITGVNVFDTINVNVWEPKAITLPLQLKNGAGNDAERILSAWEGSVAIAVQIKLNGSALNKDGKLRLIFGYNYFGTRDGKYGNGVVPLTVYS